MPSTSLISFWRRNAFLFSSSLFFRAAWFFLLNSFSFLNLLYSQLIFIRLIILLCINLCWFKTFIFRAIWKLCVDDYFCFLFSFLASSPHHHFEHRLIFELILSLWHRTCSSVLSLFITHNYVFAFDIDNGLLNLSAFLIFNYISCSKYLNLRSCLPTLFRINFCIIRFSLKLMWFSFNFKLFNWRHFFIFNDCFFLNLHFLNLNDLVFQFSYLLVCSLVSMMSYLARSCLEQSLCLALFFLTQRLKIAWNLFLCFICSSASQRDTWI